MAIKPLFIFNAMFDEVNEGEFFWISFIYTIAT
jgi:hypothetical protein